MLHTLTHDLGFGPRKSLLYVPENATRGHRSPLVLMLHGTGATAAWTLDETRWPELADREGFLVLAPEGTRADPDQPPGFLSNPLTWNAGSNLRGLGQHGGDDVSFIDELLDDVLNNFPVDPRYLFATGFSSGASMTFRLGTELCHRFCALAPVAGYCSLPDPQPPVPLSTLFLVGTEDPLVPLQGGSVVLPWDNLSVQRPPLWSNLQRWVVALGCPPQPAETVHNDGVQITRYAPGRDNVEFRVWLIDGLGHHWPGGRAGVSERLVGPPSDRVNGNEVIWAFFRECAEQCR